MLMNRNEKENEKENENEKKCAKHKSRSDSFNRDGRRLLGSAHDFNLSDHTND